MGLGSATALNMIDMIGVGPFITMPLVIAAAGFRLSVWAWLLGAAIAVAAVALCTLIVYPLAHVAPVVSLGVVYLPAVLVASVTWGVWFGVGTAVLSAAAFNFFHLPPVGRFTLQNSDNWVALGAFLVVAVLASSVAEVTRARTRDAEERRREADQARQTLSTAGARQDAELDLRQADAGRRGR